METGGFEVTGFPLYPIAESVYTRQLISFSE